MYYLCLSIEERAQGARVFSSFLVKNLIYKGRITSDVEKNTSEINFFLGFIVEFFRQVVVIMSDVEPQKVKRYLFSQGADLTFQGATQVDFIEMQCSAYCLRASFRHEKQRPRYP